jgi:aldose 1-epimerase
MHATVKTENWGTSPDGHPAHLYTLTSPNVTIKLSDYGARLVSVETPDKTGKKADILLGYPTVSDYGPGKDPYFGPIVGRFGNRLKGGTFSIDGKTYHVDTNEKGNTLHGGTVGFDRVMWTGKVVGPEAIEFTLVSPDGDQGFPGKLTAHVTYTLMGNSLKLVYSATTDKPTIVNLTEHGYWNLHGMGNGTILDQRMQIFADRYTPVAKDLIPTGAMAPVAGTPFDFRQPTPLGHNIKMGGDQITIGGGGIDHNFVLNAAGPELHKALLLYDPVSGRTMAVSTTQPGLQMYTVQGLQKTNMPNGQKYPQYGAVVLETQHFPDSPNQPKWPSTELKPGQVMHSETIFTFGVRK